MKGTCWKTTQYVAIGIVESKKLTAKVRTCFKPPIDSILLKLCKGGGGGGRLLTQGTSVCFSVRKPIRQRQEQNWKNGRKRRYFLQKMQVQLGSIGTHFWKSLGWQILSRIPSFLSLCLFIPLLHLILRVLLSKRPKDISCVILRLTALWWVSDVRVTAILFPIFFSSSLFERLSIAFFSFFFFMHCIDNSSSCTSQMCTRIETSPQKSALPWILQKSVDGCWLNGALLVQLQELYWVKFIM